MYKSFLTSILTLAFLLLYSASFAQESETPEKPKTKLETFMAQDGIVTIQGFTTIGTATGMSNTSISVDSKELLDASTGKKIYGITIEVRRALGSNIGSREHISYVDYDEIESLIKGFDYISKIDKTSTKLADFQAQYSTKDDLSIAVFSGSMGLFANPKNSSIYLSVASGSIGRTTAFFKQDDIKEVRNLIIKAKEKLDAIKE